MRWLEIPALLLPLGPLLLLSWPGAVRSGTTDFTKGMAQSAATALPLPDTGTLLRDVERNQLRLEAAQRDYTYHVHTEQQQLDKHGSPKKTEVIDAESLTLDGVRVDRVVARNGKPLTADEQTKENARLDKEVVKARERRSKATAKGTDTDARGNQVLPLSRILELGSFSNPRRLEQDRRPTILLDYAGDPHAKTRSAFEGIMRDLVGTVEIDEANRVLIGAQGHFLNDFKLGGGLVADVHKGTSIDFRAKRIDEAIWLPAVIDGQGSVRVLLFASFNGRLHVVTSDYRRFRTTATIHAGPGEVSETGRENPSTSGASGVSLPAPKPPRPE